jgi:hypothetical protein
MKMYSQVNDYIRINFIGRPLELNRLVYDDRILLSTQEEADKVVKAYRLYYGWQYLGNMLSLANLIILERMKFKRNFRNFVIVLIPMVGCYFYSHYTYWDIVRPVVIEIRKREKVVLSEEERKIIFNKTIDFQNYIQRNIGIGQCIAEIIKKYELI